MRTAISAAVLASLVLAGCSGGSSSGSATTTTTVKGIEHFSQGSQTTIVVAGKHNATFEGAAQIGVLRGPAPRETHLLTVGTLPPVQTKDGFVIDAFLNLIDFTKDGSYTIEPAPEKGGTPSMVNNTYVLIYNIAGGAAGAQASRYDVIKKPCKATIKRGGEEGTYTCPDLQNSIGDSISVTHKWKASGPKVDRLAEARKATSTTSTTVATRR